MHQQGDIDGIVQLARSQLDLASLWLVHRLDTITSGCLILAKSQAAAGEFGKLFEQRLVQKYYLAITDRKPKKRQGSIIGDLKKVRDGKWILTRKNNKPSVAHFYDKGIGNGLRLQILKPYTGQTHQLRAALNSLGATILGDQHYAGTPSDRAYLHSWQITFPWQSQSMSIQAPPTFGEQFLTPECDKLIQSLAQPEKQFNWPDEKLNKIARIANA